MARYLRQNASPEEAQLDLRHWLTAMSATLRRLAELAQQSDVRLAGEAPIETLILESEELNTWATDARDYLQAIWGLEPADLILKTHCTRCGCKLAQRAVDVRFRNSVEIYCTQCDGDIARDPRAMETPGLPG